MNKRGTSIFFGLMIAIIFFLLGLALAPALKDVTGESMQSPLLNCSSTTNDTFKAVCTSIDIQQLFIGIIFGIGGLVIWRIVI